MIKNNITVKNSNVTILGLTFKENCNDIRNSKVIDIYQELCEFGCNVNVHDPLASSEETKEEYNINLTKWENLAIADVVIAAVSRLLRKKFNRKFI